MIAHEDELEVCFHGARGLDDTTMEGASTAAGVIRRHPGEAGQAPRNYLNPAPEDRSAPLAFLMSL